MESRNLVDPQTVLQEIQDLITTLPPANKQNRAILTWQRYLRDHAALTFAEHRTRVEAVLYHLPRIINTFPEVPRLLELIQNYYALLDQAYIDSLQPINVSTLVAELPKITQTDKDKRREQIERLENEIKFAREQNDSKYLLDLTKRLDDCKKALFYHPMKSDTISQQRIAAMTFSYRAVAEPRIDSQSTNQFLSVNSLTSNR